MAETKTYVPTDEAGDWILGRWRPTELVLTARQAEYELLRGSIKLKEAEPVPALASEPTPLAAIEPTATPAAEPTPET